MRTYISKFLFLLLSNIIIAQSTFRSVTFPIISQSSVTEKVNGNLVMSGVIGTHPDFLPEQWTFPAIYEYTGEGVLENKFYLADENNLVSYFAGGDFFYLDAENNIYTTVSFEAQNGIKREGIVKINEAGAVEWFQGINVWNLGGRAAFRISENNAGNLIALAQQVGGINIAELTPDGDLLSETKIIPDFMTGINDLTIAFYGMTKTAEGNMIAAGTVPRPASALTYPVGLGVILFLNASGEPIAVRSIPDLIITDVAATPDNNIIILGNERVTPNLLLPMLIKCDLDGNVIFAYRLPYYSDRNKIAGATVAANGDILVLIQENGYPFTIMLRFTSEAELIFSKIYPGRMLGSTPKITEIQDGGLIFAAYLSESDESFSTGYTVLTKTDANGNIDGVPIKEACFDDPIPVEVVLTEHTFTTQNPGTVSFNPDLDTYSLPDGSGTIFDPPFPLPDFNLPDTICLDQCTLPTALQNQYADSQTWSATGTQVDFPAEKDPGSLCWAQPGTYTVRQIISFQNCLDTFEQTITLVPALTVALDSIAVFCPGDTPRLDATLPGATTYLWSTGATSAGIMPDTAGIYTLTASNGHCTVTDTTEVIFALNTLTAAPVSLPPDSLLCAAHFPLLLRADLPYSDTGRWQDGNTDNPRSVSAFGTYIFSTEIEGCTFSESITLTEKDCRPRIYLPNAFSPNDDGVNDFFEPLGINFTVIDMKIFDRWGNAVYDSPAARWDGRFRGEILDDAVFVCVVNYRNDETGETGQVTGSVLVVR